MIFLKQRNDEAYKELASAIVIRAVEDYRMALNALKRNPHNTEADKMAGECERFFRSSWYRILTDIDGELVIKTINEEVFGK